MLTYVKYVIYILHTLHAKVFGWADFRNFRKVRTTERPTVVSETLPNANCLRAKFLSSVFLRLFYSFIFLNT